MTSNNIYEHLKFLNNFYKNFLTLNIQDDEFEKSEPDKYTLYINTIKKAYYHHIFYNFFQDGSNSTLAYILSNYIFNTNYYIQYSSKNKLPNQDIIITQPIIDGNLNEYKNLKDYYKEKIELTETKCNYYSSGLSNHTITFIIFKKENLWYFGFINIGKGVTYHSEKSEKIIDRCNGIIIFKHMIDAAGDKINFEKDFILDILAEIMSLELFFDKNTNRFLKSSNDTMDPVEILYMDIIGSKICGINKNKNVDDANKFLFENIKGQYLVAQLPMQLAGSCSITATLLPNLYNDINVENNEKFQKSIDVIMKNYYAKILDIYKNTLVEISTNHDYCDLLIEEIVNSIDSPKPEITINYILIVLNERTHYIQENFVNLSLQCDQIFMLLNSIKIKNKLPSIKDKELPISIYDSKSINIAKKTIEISRPIDLERIDVLITLDGDFYEVIVKINDILKEFIENDFNEMGTIIVLMIKLTKKLAIKCESVTYAPNNLSAVGDDMMTFIKYIDICFSKIKFDKNEYFDNHITDKDPYNSFAFNLKIVWYLYIVRNFFPQTFGGRNSRLTEKIISHLAFNQLNLENNERIISLIRDYWDYFIYEDGVIEQIYSSTEHVYIPTELLKNKTDFITNKKKRIERIDTPTNKFLKEILKYSNTLIGRNETTFSGLVDYIQPDNKKKINMLSSLLLFYFVDFDTSYTDKKINTLTFNEYDCTSASIISFMPAFSLKCSNIYSTIDSKEVNSDFINNLMNFINRMIENNFIETDIEISLEFNNIFNFSNGKLNLYEYNIDNPKMNLMYLFASNYNVIHNIFDNYEKAPLINIFNIGLVLFLIKNNYSDDKKFKKKIKKYLCDYKTAIDSIIKIFDTNKIWAKFYLLKLVIYGAKLDNTIITNIAKIYNKYNVCPKSSTENDTTNKLNNIFSQKEKNSVNSMIMYVMSYNYMTKNLIKKFNEEEIKSKLYVYNYNESPNIQTNTVIKEDIEFIKKNEQTFISNVSTDDKAYLLVKTPLKTSFLPDITKIKSLGRIDRINSNPAAKFDDNLQTDISTYINKFSFFKFYNTTDNFLLDLSTQKNPGVNLVKLLNIVIKGIHNDFLLFINNDTNMNFIEYNVVPPKVTPNFYNIYYLDINNSVSLVGIVSIQACFSGKKNGTDRYKFEIMTKELYNVSIIAETKEWFLLSSDNKPEETTEHFYEKLIYRSLIDIPYFNKKFNEYIFGTENRIMITNVSGTEKKMTIKINDEYTLMYEITNEGGTYKLKDKKIKKTELSMDVLLLTHNNNESFEKEVVQTCIDKFKKLIKIISNVEDILNIIIWKCDNDIVLYLSSFEVLIMFNKTEGKITLNYNNKNYENLNFADETPRAYELVPDAYSLVSDKYIFCFSFYEKINTDNSFKFFRDNLKTWTNDVDYNHYLLKPSNKLYIYEYHSSKLFIKYTNLEQISYYLYRYYQNNLSYISYNVFNTFVMYLQKEINDYDNYGIQFNKLLLTREIIKKNTKLGEIIKNDLKTSRHDVIKILLKLFSFVFNNPESTILNNIALSSILNTKLHTTMREIIYSISTKNYDFEPNFTTMNTVSKYTKNKYKDYIMIRELKYKPLYYSIVSSYFAEGNLTSELKNNKIDFYSNEYVIDIDKFKTDIDNGIYNYLTFVQSINTSIAKQEKVEPLFFKNEIYGLTRYLYNFEYDNNKYMMWLYFESPTQKICLIYTDDNPSILPRFIIRIIPKKDITVSVDTTALTKTALLDDYIYGQISEIFKENTVTFISQAIKIDDTNNLIYRTQNPIGSEACIELDALNLSMGRKIYNKMSAYYLINNMSENIDKFFDQNTGEIMYKSTYVPYTNSSLQRSAIDYIGLQKDIHIHDNTMAKIKNLINVINVCEITRIKKSESEKIDNRLIGTEDTKKINTFVMADKYNISGKNYKKLIKDITYTGLLLSNYILEQKNKIIDSLNFNQIMDFKKYITENYITIEKETGLISATTLFNNLNYLNLILSDKVKELLNDDYYNINLDVFSVLCNLPFHHKIILMSDDDSKVNLKIEKREESPSCLYNTLRFLYEFSFGIIREDQLNLLYRIINNLDSTVEDKKFDLYQLIMAAGKTDVLTPYLGLYYVLSGKKFIDVTLTTLIKTTMDAVISKSLLFNVSLYNIQFSPGSLNTLDTVSANTFNNNLKLKNAIYVMSDIDFKTSILNHEKFKYHENPKEPNLKKSTYDIGTYVKEEKIINILDEYKDSKIIMDEVDEILDVVKSELNFPKEFSDGKYLPSVSKNQLNINSHNESDIKIFSFIYELSKNIFKQNFPYKQNAFKFDNMIFTSTNIKYGLEDTCLIVKFLLESGFSVEDLRLRKIKELTYETLMENMEPKLAHDINYILTDTILLLNNIIKSRHYGFGNLLDADCKDNKKSLFVALPYDGLNKPAYGSEFGNIFVTMILTCICYYKDGLNITNVFELIKNLSNEYLLKHTQLLRLADSDKKKKDLLEIELINLEKDYKIIYESLNDKIIELPENIVYVGEMLKNDYLINKYAKEKIEYTDNTENIINSYIITVFKIYIFFKNSNYNISSNDMIQKNIVKHLSGYTGTLYVENVRNILKYLNSEVKLKNDELIFNINADNVVDGEIYCCLVGEEINKPIKYYKTENNVFDNKIILQIANKKYDAITDVGSFFTNFSNKEVACIWAKYLQDAGVQSKFVLYLDNKNDKYIIDISNIMYDETDSSSINKVQSIKYDEIIHTMDKLYIYFDQSHITGINIQLPATAKGIVTIDHYNYLRDLAQGMFRLRKLKAGQSFDILLSDKACTKMCDSNKDFDKDSIKLLTENYEVTNTKLPITKYTFLNWIIEQQNKQKNNKLDTYNKQTLKTFTRLAIQNLEMYNNLLSDSRMKKLIENRQSNYDVSPYCVVVSTPTIISDYKKKIVSYFYEEQRLILEIIKKIYNVPGIFLCENNLSLPVIQLERERTQEREQEKTTEKEKEKERILIKKRTLENLMENIVPMLSLENTKELNFEKYVMFNTNKIGPEEHIIIDDDKLQFSSYYNMFLTYLKNTSQEIDNDSIVRIVEEINKGKTYKNIKKLNDAFNSLYDNYIPILPGINVSKLIYNNNRNPLSNIKKLMFNKDYPGIIISIFGMKSIFIISFSEYLSLSLYIEQNTPDVILIFSTITGKHFRTYAESFYENVDVLTPNDTQKLLMGFISLINGEFETNYYDSTECKNAIRQYKQYYGHNTKVENFWIKINQIINSVYKLNYNVMENIDLLNVVNIPSTGGFLKNDKDNKYNKNEIYYKKYIKYKTAYFKSKQLS